MGTSVARPPEVLLPCRSVKGIHRSCRCSLGDNGGSPFGIAVRQRFLENAEQAEQAHQPGDEFEFIGSFEFNSHDSLAGKYVSRISNFQGLKIQKIPKFLT